MNGLVIVEDRDLDYLQKVIDNHVENTGWELFKMDYPINSLDDYNRLLTSVAFWNIVPFDKCLIFQHDSWLLRKGIDEFMDWDYVGAPWNFQEEGGNGGLSLRTVSVMKKICESEKWDGTNEDIWFSKHLPKYGKLAPRDICGSFSVESVYFENPFGVHAPWKYLTKGELNSLGIQHPCSLKAT
jgi:hypothetical protein